MNVLGKVRRVTANYCVAMIVSIGACLAPQSLWAYPFAYIEPACPRAGEPITLWVAESRGPAGLISMNREGNTIYVTAFNLWTTPPAGLNPYGPIPLGPLPVGAYQVMINSTLTLDIAVGASPANVAGAWYNLNSPRYGFAIYQGDTSISGAYFTYRDDYTPTWYLMQYGYCTPSGFAGILNSYRGSSVDGPGSASQTPVGVWRFDPGGQNQATFTESFWEVTLLAEYPYVSYRALPPVTRPLSRMQFP